MRILGRTCRITAAQMQKIFKGGPAIPQTFPNELWSVQVIPAVCVRMYFSALSAVRGTKLPEACHRFAAERFAPFRDLRAACTRSSQRCTAAHCLAPCSQGCRSNIEGSRTGQISPLVRTSHIRKPAKLSMWIRESPSPSLSKPMNCCLGRRYDRVSGRSFTGQDVCVVSFLMMCRQQCGLGHLAAPRDHHLKAGGRPLKCFSSLEVREELANRGT